MVVAVGNTSFVPDKDTVPISWSIETAVAPVTFHDRFAFWPLVMVPGLTLNDVIAGGFAGGGAVGVALAGVGSVGGLLDGVEEFPLRAKAIPPAMTKTSTNAIKDS